jgi:hypothetical protein
MIDPVPGDNRRHFQRVEAMREYSDQGLLA